MITSLSHHWGGICVSSLRFVGINLRTALLRTQHSISVRAGPLQQHKPFFCRFAAMLEISLVLHEANFGCQTDSLTFISSVCIYIHTHTPTQKFMVTSMTAKYPCAVDATQTQITTCPPLCCIMSLKPNMNLSNMHSPSTFKINKLYFSLFLAVWQFQLHNLALGL